MMLLVPTVLLAFFNSAAFAQLEQNEIERALLKADPTSWTFRPNNLYRSARYRPNSSICGHFPGAGLNRVACSAIVEAVVDTCSGRDFIVDRLTYRIIMTNDGQIIASIH